ncbi:MAG: beta-ketoacyl synthase [Phycisphaerales bacterium]
MSRRVVITGVGAVTPFGVGADALWEGLLSGESRLAPIQRFDASAFRSSLAGEVKDFAAKDFVPKSYRKAVKVMARDIELAVGAAKCAVEDAGILTKGILPEGEEGTPTYDGSRVGCHIGAGLIAAETDELTGALATAVAPGGDFDLKTWGERGMQNLQPLWLLKYLPNMLACHVTIIHDARGPSNTITCAEASGLLSIGESLRVIERGDADICFSGGAESKVNLMGLIRMDLAGRLAPTHSERDGSKCVRPYDTEAQGGIIGEGGGIVMLESAETAAARGAKPYAEVAGFGAGHSPRSDDPQERAEGLIAAIESALEDAAISPDAIDAIVPHASGIREVDSEEASAFARVFGKRLGDIPLITLTPSIGDLMAGSGGVAAGVGAMCVRRQALPARLHAGRPATGLRAEASGQRDARLTHVLVCTNALGGQNAALVLKAV